MRKFLSIAFIALIASAAAQAALFSRFVVFGDSLSDNGNAYIGSGGFTPVPPLYTVGRFTDGPDTLPPGTAGGIWHEVLSGLLQEPVAEPFLSPVPSPNNTNFAVGGAQVLQNVSTPFGTIPSLTNQVADYLSATPGNLADPNALYVFWGGANDFYNAIESGDTAAQIAATETDVVNTLAADISGLAATGARNFLWLNLPQLATTPRGAADIATVSPGVATAFTDASTQFASDVALDSAVLESSLGIKIADVNIYSLYQKIMADPHAYGYMNVTDPAQGLTGVNPDQYLFWDFPSHPTTTGHALIAKDAESAINATFAPEPATFGAISAGLLFLLWRRRAAA